MYMYFFLMSRGRRHFLYARADVKFIISGQNNFDSSSFTGFLRYCCITRRPFLVLFSMKCACRLTTEDYGGFKSVLGSKSIKLLPAFLTVIVNCKFES